MTAIEIFSKIGTQMVKGMMTHEQLMNAYMFLGLKGNATCHEYHYISETKSYILLCKFSIDHFGMMINIGSNVLKVPDIIPKTWFDNDKTKVDSKTRSQAIEEALNTWIEWEESTKDLYQSLYLELVKIDVPASEYLKELILDVDEELVYAKNERLTKAAMNYDIVSILEEQDSLVHSFKKKINKKR